MSLGLVTSGYCFSFMVLIFIGTKSLCLVMEDEYLGVVPHAWSGRRWCTSTRQTRGPAALTRQARGPRGSRFEWLVVRVTHGQSGSWSELLVVRRHWCTSTRRTPSVFISAVNRTGNDERLRPSERKTHQSLFLNTAGTKPCEY